MRLPISPNASLMLIAPLALIGSVASNQVAIAQSEPAHTYDSDYEHFYIGVDGFDLLQSGNYAGLENPNSGRLTFLYSHVEEDPTTNHFHGIGSYSYSGAVDSPTINSTNIRALRKQIRTVFKCGIDTIMKAVKFVPSLPPPVFEYKPPMLYLIYSSSW